MTQEALKAAWVLHVLEGYPVEEALGIQCPKCGAAEGVSVAREWRTMNDATWCSTCGHVWGWGSAR